jgi:short-subunit dehydrogenase
MSPARTIIIVGAGPGIGDNVASTFASKGFNHVVLLARNVQRLQSEDTAFITKAAPNVKVDSVKIDLTDIPSIPAVLKQIEGLIEGENLEVVFFNAARVKPSGVFDAPVEEIEEDLKVKPYPFISVPQHI